MCITCNVQNAVLEIGSDVWWCTDKKKYLTRLSIAQQIYYYFEQIGHGYPTQKEFDQKLSGLYTEYQSYCMNYEKENIQPEYPSPCSFKEFIYCKGRDTIKITHPNNVKVVGGGEPISKPNLTTLIIIYITIITLLVSLIIVIGK